ncbi:hypothetical protein KDJ56_10985 [Brevibacillus composti]|uniref:Uncharacterized protein n=1 Tax=Brevibacillus composti TaxID=2796470 RepID=A0ABX7ZAU3_9BACL|nr:hypothetical protein [Brevibacillus composti]QUO43425.1 hypothetical protein KDJ56_10985 [Brevibacillus composti]
MSNVLREQRDASAAIAREILGDIKLDVTDGEIAVSSAQEEALEEYAALLEKREQELIAELHRTVLHLSAKIAATRNLRYMAAREAGKQIGLRMGSDSNERGERKREEA